VRRDSRCWGGYETGTSHGGSSQASGLCLRTSALGLHPVAFADARVTDLRLVVGYRGRMLAEYLRDHHREMRIRCCSTRTSSVAMAAPSTPPASSREVTPSSLTCRKGSP
jgi:hypothetical protein